MLSDASDVLLLFFLYRNPIFCSLDMDVYFLVSKLSMGALLSRYCQELKPPKYDPQLSTLDAVALGRHQNEA